MKSVAITSTQNLFQAVLIGEYKVNAMSSESVPDRGWCVPAGHVGDRKNPALLPVVQCLRKPDQLDVNWNMNSFTGSAEEAALACERTVWMDQALIEGLGAGLADDKRRSKQAVVQLVMQLGPWMRQQNLLQDTWTGEGRPPPGMAAVKRIKTCKGPSPVCSLPISLNIPVQCVTPRQIPAPDPPSVPEECSHS